MPKYHPEIQQGTDAWLEKRLGKFTASDFHIMLGKSQTKIDKLWEIVAERMLGDTDQEPYSSYAMERGKILEVEARRTYAFANEIPVDETGFVEPDEDNPWFSYVGCSPDGLVGEDGLIEIKSPLAKNFLQWTEPGENGREVKYIKPEYYTQIMFNLMVTERKWCDFCYYHPRLGLVTKRYERDEEHIAKITEALNQCIEFVKQQIGVTDEL